MTERRLLLVRHGVTEWNREGRFQGRSDPPLADGGQAEAARLAARLAGDPLLRPGRIVTSTLSRARQTADAIAAVVGVAPIADERWCEIGQGEWEGRTHAELEVHDRERYLAWRDADGIRQPPAGEPIDAVRARVRAALDDLVGGDGWPACIVSHGGTLRVTAAILLGFDGEHHASVDIDNASLSVLTHKRGTWGVERWNDTRHVLGLEPTHVDEADGRPRAL